jgi:hypothetical protein
VAGGDSVSPPPDIPSSTLTSDLDDTQKAALCDWSVGALGGYGQVLDCGMTTHIFPVDQAECVAMQFAAYCAKATVGQFVTCVTAEIPSKSCVTEWDQCHQLSCL